MNTKDIKILIDAFYEGKTNPDEELLLLRYFESDQIAQELLIEKEIFLQLYAPEPVCVPDSLKNKVTNLIDTLDKKENRKIGIRRKTIIQWAGIAASISIIAFAGIFMDKVYFGGSKQTFAERNETTAMYSQLSDTEYAELNNALFLLSSNFNKGLEQLDEMNHNLEKTSDILNKTFKR